MALKVILSDEEMKMLEIFNDELEFHGLSFFKGKFEVDKSHNDDFPNFKYNDSTKLIIVGTMTPPKIKFYYSNYSQKNDYNTLNYLFDYYKEKGKTSLISNDLYKEINDFKKDLDEINENDKKTIEEKTSLLINGLNEKGILFLDVVKYVLRPVDSSKDEDFVCLSLDVDNFVAPLEKFFAPNSSLKIVTNSVAAESYLKQIIKEINNKRGIKYKFSDKMPNYIRVSQRTIGETMKKKNYEEWSEVLASLN